MRSLMCHCAAVMLVLVVCGAGLSAEIIDRILAVVDSQPITLSDVNAVRLLRLLPDAPAAADPGAPADQTAALLDRLIDRALVLTEVDRYQPPEPAAEEIDRRVAAVETAAGGPDALQRAMQVTGFSRDQLRRWVRDDLRIDTYLNQRFGTSDPSARPRAMIEWLRGLRRRSDVNVLYLGK